MLNESWRFYEREFMAYKISEERTCKLFEPPLGMFGTDAVERYFTEKKVEELIKFVQRLVELSSWRPYVG